MVFREDSVVYISEREELSDDGRIPELITTGLGGFVEIDDDTREETPLFRSIAQALGWARERSGRIYIRVAGAGPTYWAGEGEAPYGNVLKLDDLASLEAELAAVLDQRTTL